MSLYHRTATPTPLIQKSLITTLYFKTYAKIWNAESNSLLLNKRVVERMANKGLMFLYRFGIVLLDLSLIGRKK